MESKAIFSRTMMTSTGREVSASAFNFIIGLVLCWGFLLNWWMVENIPVERLREINPFLFLGFYIISAFLGIFIFTKSSSPFLSFVGYNFVVVPFGLVVNLLVANYDPNIVSESIQITALVTLIMMAMGTFFPGFFSHIAGTLTVALLSVIGIELVLHLFFQKQYAIIDWIVVLIFCGYIGVDWGRANRIPKTVDNAVDSAAALYMDIINLFVRILSIFGRRKKSW